MYIKRVLLSFLVVNSLISSPIPYYNKKRKIMLKSDDFIESSLKNKIGQGTYNRKIKETTRTAISLNQQSSKAVLAKKRGRKITYKDQPIYDASELLSVPANNVALLTEEVKPYTSKWVRIKEFFGIKNTAARARVIKEYGETNPYLKQTLKKKGITDVRHIPDTVLEKKVADDDIVAVLKTARMRKKALTLKSEVKSILSLLEKSIGTAEEFDKKPLFVSVTSENGDTITIECGAHTLTLEKEVLKLLSIKSSLATDEAALISTDNLLAFLHGKLEYTPSKIIKLNKNAADDTYTVPKNIVSGKAHWHDLKVDIFKNLKSYKTLYGILDKYMGSSLPMTRKGFYYTASILPYFIQDFFNIIPSDKQKVFLKLLNKISQRIKNGTLYLSPSTVEKLNTLIKKIKKKK